MLVMKIIAFFMVVLGIAYFYNEARAYVVTGMKYDHTAITYSCGDPVTAEALQMWASVSGLTDGGCSATPDILMTYPAQWDIPNAIGWASYTSTAGHTIKQCTIAIRSDAAGFIGVYLHEIGHCLGSSHSEVQDSTMSPYCCHWLAPDDIAMIQSLYGPEVSTIVRRAIVPMVSQ